MSDRSYLDEWREEGSAVGDGRFSVDAPRAREKLQKFRLPDPHRYVLQFVQAAHLLGASRIEVQVDADEVDLYFDGDPLTRRDLEGLESSAFRRRMDRRDRAVRHLAIGVIAARDVDPARIVITSGREGEAGVRWADGADEERGARAALGPDRGTTHIYLRETLRASHLTAFLHKFGADLTEERLVREHCRFSTVPVHLGGERVSRGLHLPGDTVGRTVFETEHGCGVVGFREPESVDWRERTPVGRRAVVQHGVTVVEEALEGPAALSAIAPCAVLESEELTKDLSENAFVRDEAWRALMYRVVPEYLFEAVTGYIGRFRGDDVERHRNWLTRLACDLWGHHAALESGAAGRLAEQLRGLPIWPVASRPLEETPDSEFDGPRWASLATFRGDSGTILYSRASVPPMVETGFDRPVFDRSAVGPDVPSRLLADARDVTASLLTSAEHQTGNTMWSVRREAMCEREIHQPAAGDVSVGDDVDTDAVTRDTLAALADQQGNAGGGESATRERSAPPDAAPEPSDDEEKQGYGPLLSQFVALCGRNHPFFETLPPDRVTFGATAAQCVELRPTGLVFDRSHPAAAYLLELDDAEGGELSGDDPIRLAFVVSSLYTALSRKIGGTSEGDDFDFHARHVRAVGG